MKEGLWLGQLEGPMGSLSAVSKVCVPSKKEKGKQIRLQLVPTKPLRTDEQWRQGSDTLCGNQPATWDSWTLPANQQVALPRCMPHLTLRPVCLLHNY